MKIKKILVGLLIVVMSICVMGCGTEKNNESQTIQNDVNEEKIVSENNIVGENNEAKNTIRVVTDCAGREVEIPKKIEKIVDLGIDGTKALIQLGAKDKVVGLTGRGIMSFDASETENKKFKWMLASKVAPEMKDLPVVGMTFREPNVEAILKLNPDVIFIPFVAGDKIEALQEQTKIPVLCMSNHTNLNFEMLKLVGKIIGEEEKAEKIISASKSLIKEITDVTSHIAKEEKVKVYIVTPPSSPSENEVLTKQLYAPIDLAGGYNLAENAEVKINSFKTSKEQIAVWNPDVILVSSSYILSNKKNSDINIVLQDSMLNDTNAVKNNKVYSYTGWDYGWDVATAVVQVPYFAKLFYPNEFPNIDIESKCNAILKEYYGLDGLYTQMLSKYDLYDWKAGK